MSLPKVQQLCLKKKGKKRLPLPSLQNLVLVFQRKVWKINLAWGLRQILWPTWVHLSQLFSRGFGSRLTGITRIGWAWLNWILGMNGQTFSQDQIKYMIMILGAIFFNLIILREIKGVEKEHTGTLPWGLWKEREVGFWASVAARKKNLPQTKNNHMKACSETWFQSLCNR